MADDKLKQELFYMVSLTSKYDFTRMEVVEGILRLENERKILDSVFGRRFKSRIFDIAAGVATDDSCVLCGQPAENHVICKHCMDAVLESNYAKNKIKNKQIKFDFTAIKNIFGRLTLKKCFQYAAIVCLIMILFIQIWILSLWHSIPDINPIVPAVVSSYQAVPVSNIEEAQSQLVLDFPEEQGYTVTFVREDTEYVGRFLLEKGDCCLDIEEQLTDEERYDYFFTEPVYVFYISCIEEHSARVGMAEVNEGGSILVKGSFNDGRRTDSFYKYR